MKDFVRRLQPVAVAMLLLACTQTAFASPSIVGTWNAQFSVNGVACSMQTVYQPNAAYSELLHCGSLMTHQSGTYVLHGNLLVRSVEDWAPKQQWVVGSCVGCGYYENTAKPPGGSYNLSFPNSNTMTMKDVNLGGTITMHRQ
ncbi:MAG TPA: hypothetical protein VEJ20_01360 [Candidatus Eremiobacteraceae bacterium]|nr:hypothetical protein [Candidatus Eremiobacteraceae bacterium]